MNSYAESTPQKRSSTKNLVLSVLANFDGCKVLASDKGLEVAANPLKPPFLSSDRVLRVLRVGLTTFSARRQGAEAGLLRGGEAGSD